MSVSNRSYKLRMHARAHPVSLDQVMSRLTDDPVITMTLKLRLVELNDGTCKIAVRVGDGVEIMSRPFASRVEAEASIRALNYISIETNG